MSGKNHLVKTCRQAAVWVERLSHLLAGTLLAINVLTILFSVISRYVFRSSYIWTEELARFSLVYFVMFAANAAWRRDEHMRIEIVERHLPKVAKDIVNWIKRAAVFVIFAFMTWEGYAHALRALNSRTIGLNVPRAVPLMAIPIGMGLLLLQFVFTEISGLERGN